MLNPATTITAVNKALAPFFSDDGSPFILTQHKVSNVFRLRVTEANSQAYDNHGNGGEFVKVVKWFKNFWMFVEISFTQPFGVIITVSIFQGDDLDFHKTQLFRAEWDDYNDDTQTHAQPHWHFLSNVSIEKTVSNFAELIPDIKDTFEEVLKEEKNKVIDLGKFHFAMNGDWSNSGQHVHEIYDAKLLSNWFGGLLGYLKAELEFVDSKTKGA